jgi:hypothetical protein
VAGAGTAVIVTSDCMPDAGRWSAVKWSGWRGGDMLVWIAAVAIHLPSLEARRIPDASPESLPRAVLGRRSGR